MNYVEEMIERGRSSSLDRSLRAATTLRERHLTASTAWSAPLP